MTKYEKVRSTVKPEPVVIDAHSVWVHTIIVPVEEEGFAGFEYDTIQYGKDEYIRLMDTQLTDTQLALAELYEGMVG